MQVDSEEEGTTTDARYHEYLEPWDWKPLQRVQIQEIAVAGQLGLRPGSGPGQADTHQRRQVSEA